jgi:ribonuclease HI
LVLIPGSISQPLPGTVRQQQPQRQSSPQPENKGEHKAEPSALAACVVDDARVTDTAIIATLGTSPRRGYTAITAWKSVFPATNNISELEAIELGLELAMRAAMTMAPLPEKDAQQQKSKCVIEIMTDSQWALGILESGWKVKANKELVERIKKKIHRCRSNLGHTLRIHWVRGHCGIGGNEMAHKLAQQGTAACLAS